MLRRIAANCRVYATAARKVQRVTRTKEGNYLDRDDEAAVRGDVAVGHVRSVEGEAGAAFAVTQVWPLVRLR